ncbi:hypothetical protein M409DRAFT_24420 [Zasmidium cellare ATCC 36951]|uniref:F-box domain-containing protein n=1 Tax=Zasmidium cellare ATCC 36951 TaxID=1080233 RepID=A0A6A6CEA8_ZASCE|nr:uncharacterized protein M409DRAFT_24420 [Zasmidium cellare ATCC 36951]KAF2165033.1 hypothetical protein M409DRAFT_24420 [Zasmidium cellare ATCC 36951]
MDTPAESRFLLLPRELRDAIYEFAMINDIEMLSEHLMKPSLLRVCRQTNEEYADIFFSNHLLRLDTFSGQPPTWTSVQDKDEKQAIFENCVFRNLTDFWSLGSARRFCQRRFDDLGGDLKVGILSTPTVTGLRRWQWNMESRAQGVYT